MKTQIKYVWTAMAAVILLLGCDNQLDIAPKQSIESNVALSTSENVEATLVGAYDRLAGGFIDIEGDADNNGYGFGGYNLFEPDLLADDGEVRWTGTFEEPEQIWRKRMQVENIDIEETWRISYETINIVNNVLSALDVVIEDQRDRVEGEARFIRGLVYFALLELYAQPWSAGNQTSNLGVPLITEPTTVINEASQVPRGTVAEGYNQVISDLSRAESILPESNGRFATSGAAAAVLSRVYLQQADYANARDAANRVIQSGQYSLLDNYADCFNNINSNTAEDVFAIQISSQDGLNAMNTFYAPDEFGGRGDITILQAHLNLYESGDERATLFFSDNNGVTRTGKWIEIFGNVNIVRLAEMYLTRAEGNNREGTTVGDTPLNDVNRIRDRAGLPGLSSVDLAAILRERKLELAFEGQLLHDVKRTQQDVGPLPFDAPELVYPIPQREIDVNQNLQQNTGY
ncbi:MAG: RagB/SusD family nutrient uptake outer membrane protein [Balneolaceae bacterium]|jgi:hypothetical protein